MKSVQRDGGSGGSSLNTEIDKKRKKDLRSISSNEIKNTQYRTPFK
jgi:hypothetical protein